MLVIVGHTRSHRNVERLRRLGWGRCAVERRLHPYPGEPWMLDNGRYAAFNQAHREANRRRTEAGLRPLTSRAFAAGECPEPGDLRLFHRWLRRAAAMVRRGEGPRIVVAPDVVQNGLLSEIATLEWMECYKMRFAKHLDPVGWYYGLRHGQLPIYLAVQDGMSPDEWNAELDPETDEPLLSDYAGILLGGSDRYKAEAGRDWRAVTRAHRMRMHYGRAGTPAKVRHARELEVDSLDSAFPLWTEERLSAFVTDLTEGPSQRDLFS